MDLRDEEEDRDRARHAVRFLAGLLGVALVMAACVALAAEVFRGTDDQGAKMSLTLHEEPCTHAAVQAHLVRMRIPPEFLVQFKRATLFYWGREWASCWIDLRGRVFSVDEEGASLRAISRDLFSEATI